jgi:hypothetical protein
VALWRAIRERRLANVTDNDERILGRKPIALDQWLIENAAVFRSCDGTAEEAQCYQRRAADKSIRTNLKRRD